MVCWCRGRHVLFLSAAGLQNNAQKLVSNQKVSIDGEEGARGGNEPQNSPFLKCCSISVMTLLGGIFSGAFIILEMRRVALRRVIIGDSRFPLWLSFLSLAFCHPVAGGELYFALKFSSQVENSAIKASAAFWGSFKI